MKNYRTKLTIALACALGLFCLLIGILIPTEKSGEDPAVSKASERSAPEDSVAPDLAIRPPRLGEVWRFLVMGPDEQAVPLAAVPPIEELPQDQIAILLSQPRDLSDPSAHELFVAELKRLEDLEAKRTGKKASELGLPLMSEHGAFLAGFAGEVPLYEISHNAEVAISIGTDLVRAQDPFLPDGEGHQIGLWDVYWGPTLNHVDLANVNLKDDAVSGGLHASHVAGTLIGAGSDPLARGMAPQAELWSFSSNNVLSELSANAAQGNQDFSKLFVSLHPYGVASGWEFDGQEWYGSFSNDGDSSNDVPEFLGRYDSSASSWDGTASSFPFHLIVKSAGNHRDDAPPAAGEDWYLNGGSRYTYNPASHPIADGAHNGSGGYGTIDPRAGAKNVLTVGSVSEAVTGGLRDPGAAVLSEFSSAGPTDDGRIKPDLVGNGDTVYSVDGSSTDRYFTASGTSMSSAGVAGSAVLLQEIYRDYKGKAMRASTLKGLLIHTADDLETPGPDYRTGWGLANVQAAAELLDDDNASAALDRLEQARLNGSDPQDYYVVAVDGAGPVRVTLCWTDKPGNWTNGHDNRSPRLVNDLNLRLVSLDGLTTHSPYVMPFTYTWGQGELSAPAMTGVNTVDNVEQVYVEAPAAGLYRIVVDHAGILQGGQRYSLFVSGTHLQGEGVEVVSPIADQTIMADDPTPITAFANANEVFSGSGHQFEISWTPEGILTAEVDALGNVNITPTTTGFGPVEVTLTATDANFGTAQTSFTITALTSFVRVNSLNTAAPIDQHGGTWEGAFKHLQDALAVAIPGQEIWVADGVYFPDARIAGDSNNRDESFILTSGIGVYGGFNGTELLRSERDPNSGATILSGDIRQDDLQQPIATWLSPQSGEGNNSHHVLRITGGSTDVTLDGFVVTAGHATDFGMPDGGGLHVATYAEAHIENCLFIGNRANDKGGAIAVGDSSDVDIVKCSLIGNKSGVGGGGLSSYWGTVYLSHCEFRGNESSDGGAIHLNRDWMTLVDCVFSGNKGFFGAGALHQEHGWFKMLSCTMTGNSTFGDGGAIRTTNSQGSPYVFNSIIWNNIAGGSTTSTSASAWAQAGNKLPYYENSLVANSGGSGNWNWAVGWDGWENVDGDPRFETDVNPALAPSVGGDFRLTVGSPAINAGTEEPLSMDDFDLDGDGDLAEPLPVDLAGAPRLVSAALDMGAYELGDLGVIDGDNDGLSDEFEIAHGGDLDPMSDDDGDGLTALAEFLHGLNPNEPLREPVGRFEKVEYLGSQYVCMTYLVNPDALNFVIPTVERRGNLSHPAGWLENQTVEISAVASTTHPGLVEVTHRSLTPFGEDRMEFLRIRHDVIPSGTQTIPQSDPRGSTSVSGWNVWGQ